MQNTPKSLKHTLLLGSLVVLVAAFSAVASQPADGPLAGQDAAATVQPVAIVEATARPVSYAAPQVINAADLEGKLTRLYQQANPSVVYLISSNGTSGSGFVYDQQGHIVTNRHVIAGAGSVEVVFSNGERLPGNPVGADADSDLAVLKVEKLPSGVTPLALASQESIQVGQLVAAIGNPFGEQGSMSLGIISGLGRNLPSQRNSTYGGYSLPEVIQTDAPINPGNSGGPLLNLAGEVVGVTSAIATETGANSGVGFAIPAQALQVVIPDLIESGKHVYSYMGVGYDDEITLQDQALYALPQTTGAYLLGVTQGSPAASAGLVAADPYTGQGGDLIIAIDGLPVASFADINRYLVYATHPGQVIELTVLRDGAEKTVQLTLGARP